MNLSSRPEKPSCSSSAAMSPFVDTSIWYAAAEFWERLRAGVAAIEPVDIADFESAWQIGISFPDQDFSIFDRTSFAVMRQLGIERAASLDDDFAIFRFGPNRRRAFTILR